MLTLPSRFLAHYKCLLFTRMLPPNRLTMGDLATEHRRRRPRFLCLHGFRTSGEIMRKQVMEKWPERVTSRLDLFFADAPFPAEGKSSVEGLFDPPYYEWFQLNEEYDVRQNFDDCVAFIEDLIIKHGPFDGFMGFSQGGALSAALTGLQAKGLALKRVPQVKNVVIISGINLSVPAFDVKIECPSLHFIGELDNLKKRNEALLDAFVDPIVVYHTRGHTVPKLDDNSVVTVLGYIEHIEKILNGTDLSPSLSTCEKKHSICNSAL